MKSKEKRWGEMETRLRDKGEKREGGEKVAGRGRRQQGGSAKKRGASSSPKHPTRSTTCKQVDSPAKNTRFSMRVSKPSKKRHGSDYA
jgi:hypothetical protein